MSDKKIRIFLFGLGNLGTHLLKEILRYPEQLELTGVWTHSPEKVLPEFKKYLFTGNPGETPEADIYILALKDDVVPRFSRYLKNKNGLVVHTSGVLPKEVLSVRRKGYFYPLQSFRKEKPNYNWKEIPVFIDADTTEDYQLLWDLGNLIGGAVYHISPGQKEALHVAAVFANNFSNAMYIISQAVLKHKNLNFDLLLPLIRETAGRLAEFTPEKSQTGPAIRHDQKTIDKHLNLLKDYNMTEEAKIYRILSDYIQYYFDPKN